MKIKKESEKNKKYKEKPAGALEKDELQKIKYKKGRIYRVSYRIEKFTTGYFEGELIQEEKNFITLKNKKGLIESFLKADFEIGEKKIKEVIR